MRPVESGLLQLLLYEKNSLSLFRPNSSQLSVKCTSREEHGFTVHLIYLKQDHIDLIIKQPSDSVTTTLSVRLGAIQDHICLLHFSVTAVVK